MKISGKSDLILSLELASSTIGLQTDKSYFGYFQNLNANQPFDIQEMYEMWLVAIATEVFFSSFFLSVPLCTSRIFKMLFLKMTYFKTLEKIPRKGLELCT